MQTVTNGIDMHAKLIGHRLRGAECLRQHKGFGEARTIGGIVFEKRGEQFASEGFQVFGEPGIFQQAIQAECVDIQEIFREVLAARFLCKRDSLCEGHSHFRERAVARSMYDPEGLRAAVLEQGIAHFCWWLRAWPVYENDGHVIIDEGERAFQAVQHDAFSDGPFAGRFRSLDASNRPCQYPDLPMLYRQSQAVAILFDVLQRFALQKRAYPLLALAAQGILGLLHARNDQVTGDNQVGEEIRPRVRRQGNGGTKIDLAGGLHSWSRQRKDLHLALTGYP